VGIARVRLPAHNLNLSIYSGHISRQDLLDYYSEVDANNPALDAPHITYLAPDTDLTRLDLTAFVQLKQTLAPKVKVLAQCPAFRCVAVCSTEQCEMIVRFWRAYLMRDPTYPSPPAFFRDLQDACGWLKLPASAYAAAKAAIREHEAEPGAWTEPTAPPARTDRYDEASSAKSRSASCSSPPSAMSSPPRPR
jgi:hypothetical protein